VVVNDGSTDGTLARLDAAFDLAPARVAARETVPIEPIQGAFVSRRHPNLRVVDKLNGGKGDALNAGLAVARYPYLCAVDADAIIEEDALLRVARPMIEDPDLVVAAGGIVRIANGCRIVSGRVEEVALPKSRLATFQVVEYFRAFLVGRVGWSRLRSLLIISGAFGLFRRAEVEAAGGWATDTVGEDAELVTRLHRHLRERGEDYRIQFVPDPVCWTEAPEDLRQLSRQRRRWQRGLAETMWRHRRMIGNPRFGAFGVLALPYFLVFELLGPAIELGAFLFLPFAWVFGMLDGGLMLAFLATAVVLGVVLSVSALMLEEFSFRRHGRHRDVGRMLAFAVLENFGFRQLVDAWRLWALVDVVRRKQAWGVMERRGLARTETGRI
jgi:cellulose synthase/poly-beta-1,6-N-acetylglucosamine synthase-like glycosyltransferase